MAPITHNIQLYTLIDCELGKESFVCPKFCVFYAICLSLLCCLQDRVTLNSVVTELECAHDIDRNGCRRWPANELNVADTSHSLHDDVIKWKHFPRDWPFVRWIHWYPVNSPYKSQWRGALMFPLICVWINGWVNNREAGDLRRFRAHYDVTVMFIIVCV